MAKSTPAIPPSCTMTRTFHPVGQGAFYSEEFLNNSDNNRILYTAVYDCGSNLKTTLKKRIEDERHIVDLLFISHFHEDHINGVETLLENNRQQGRGAIIVIPGVSQFRFIVDLLSNFAKTGDIGCDSIKFMLRCLLALKSPRSTIPHIENNCQSNPQIAEEIVALSPSASPAVVKRSFCWCYDVFYNEIANSKEKEIIKALSDRVPLLSDVLSAPDKYQDREWYDHFLSELSKLEASSRIRIDDIKRAFTDVFGKLHNAYSMLVYSHPVSEQYLSYGCLYTGDAEAATVRAALGSLKPISPSYIQVPHHGSDKNHDPKIYAGRPIALISVGQNSPFNHPGRTAMVDLIQKCHFVHIVTEKSRAYKRDCPFGCITKSIV